MRSRLRRRCAGNVGICVSPQVQRRVDRYEFNAAGDFDRLLPFSPHLLLLGSIDPYDQVEFGPRQSYPWFSPPFARGLSSRHRLSSPEDLASLKFA
jgi:hypothetical protein